MKNKIRPLYSRLQGYLSQAPPQKEPFDRMAAEPLCTMVNSTFIELQEVTGNNYSTHLFGMNEIESDRTTHVIFVSTFRGKLGGIIAELHGKYFFDEPAPFSGMPHMVINQSASQNQTIQFSMILDIQSKIDKELYATSDPKEKSFLEEVKSKLLQVKNVVELFSLIIVTAQSYGITVDRLKHLFGI